MPQRHRVAGRTGQATIAVLIAIVLFSRLLAGLVACKHLDYRRSHVSQYVASIAQLLHNELSFLRRTVLTIRYYPDARAPDPSREAGYEAFRRTGAASVHAESAHNAYHLLAAA